MSADLRELLLTLAPSAPERLRNVLIRDHADRDANAMELMRHRDENEQRWVHVIDFLPMHPDARRLVVRVLGEIDAAP